MDIKQAQTEIARILASVEKEHGALVNDVSIESIDVTNLKDDRPRHVRQVRIFLSPVPACDWSQV